MRAIYALALIVLFTPAVGFAGPAEDVAATVTAWAAAYDTRDPQKITALYDERNPPELGVMEQTMTRLQDGRYVLLPVTAASRGHGTTQNATTWKQHLAAALVDLPAQRP